MKNSIYIFVLFLLSTVITLSSPVKKKEVKEDPIIEADYQITKNKFNVTFNVTDSIQ